ncbi:unnamed protein product [Urochloa humidicola]
MKAAKDDKKLLVLEFTAQSSRPCQDIKTVVEEVAEAAESKAHFYEVDVDQNKSVVRRLYVDTQKLPTFIVVKGKYVADKLVGDVSKEKLLDSIEAYKVE